MIQLIKSGQVSHYLGLYREGRFLHTIRRRYFDCCCVTSTSSGEDISLVTYLAPVEQLKEILNMNS